MKPHGCEISKMILARTVLPKCFFDPFIWSTSWQNQHWKWSVRPAETKVSLGIRPVWSESSLSAWNGPLGRLLPIERTAKTDQTGRMPRLICLRRAHMSFSWFCHEAAYFLGNVCYCIVTIDCWTIYFMALQFTCTKKTHFDVTFVTFHLCSFWQG